MGDSTFKLQQTHITKLLYTQNDFASLWSDKEQWLSQGDSLYYFIENAQRYGLFPEDYSIEALKRIREKFITDSLGKKDRKDAALWAKADLMLTDAFVQIVKDVKLGRLPNDSVSLRKDSTLSDEFYLQHIDHVKQKGLFAVIHSLEPTQPEYTLLKKGIKKFLDSADYRQFTTVPYPAKDSRKFNHILQTRLFEGGFISFDSTAADSIQLADAVKRFQKKKGITVDGKAGEGTVRMLNINDREKFIRIAISLDKYKLMPEKMPDKYIWVNTAANYLQVMEREEVKLIVKSYLRQSKNKNTVAQ